LLQILLQDKYNIGVLTVNIEYMWLGTKRMERLAKARLSPVSKPRHINSIFTVNTPIFYIYQEFYYDIIYIANEGSHVRFYYISYIFSIILKTKCIMFNRIILTLFYMDTAVSVHN